ncbi:hypothetical protein [uncultured Dokdonia sp.]|uniref:hypothetical protein n=1 Tax=uncultured Dokdonia sp. TaxID=575653 RepID=UPI0026166D6A|nr:hypothetical protein [uncultured Dokdonia sp.]
MIYPNEAIPRTTAIIFLKEFASFFALTIAYTQAIPQKKHTIEMEINKDSGMVVLVNLLTPFNALVTRNEIKAITPK